MEIFDQFITSYELISSPTRELKLQRIFEYIYVKHYSKVSGRAGAVALLGQLIKVSEGSTLAKFIVNKIIDGSFTLSKLIEKEVAYVPANDYSIVHNIIKSNLFRANPLSAQCLASLLTVLFSKTAFVDKSLDIMDRLF